MGKHLTVEQLKRRLEIAEKRRAAKLAAKLASPKPYKERPPEVILFYRSVFDNDIFYRVSVNSETLGLIGGAAQVGLLTALPDGASAVPIRGSGVSPTMLKWYYGDANPVVVTTTWGSRYIKNYDPQSGQSHRSIPLSVASGAFKLSDLEDKFDGLFGASGTKLGLLGVRGQAEMVIERKPIRS